MVLKHNQLHYHDKKHTFYIAVSPKKNLILPYQMHLFEISRKANIAGISHIKIAAFNFTPYGESYALIVT